jgi:hypothetical protein
VRQLIKEGPQRLVTSRWILKLTTDPSDRLKAPGSLIQCGTGTFVGDLSTLHGQQGSDHL